MVPDICWARNHLLLYSTWQIIYTIYDLKYVRGQTRSLEALYHLGKEVMI